MIKKTHLGIIFLTFILGIMHVALSSDGCCDDNVKIVVSDPWARIPKSPNKNTAVYFKITNNTGKDITLVAVSASEVTDSAVLHESYVDELGIGRMRHVNKILLPNGTEIAFAPQKTHIMIFNLKTTLSAGDKFDLKLHFDDGLSINTEVLVGHNPINKLVR